jgi:hypothetical protein
MELKARQVYEAAAALKQLRPGEKRDGVKLPIKGGYWVARLEAKLEPEVAVMEKKREELVAQYGTKDEKGNTAVSGEALVSFVKDWMEVMEETITVDAPKIKVDFFGSVDLDYVIIAALEPFIDSE